MGATNRTEQVDDAPHRHSRLSADFCISLPNQVDSDSILQAQLARRQKPPISVFPTSHKAAGWLPTPRIAPAIRGR